MAVGYRAILRLEDSTSAIDLAGEQVHDWIVSKVKGRRGGTMSRDEWAGEGRHVLSPNVEVIVTKWAAEAGGSRLQLIRLRDINPYGTWTVSIYALDRPASSQYEQTLVVDVDIEGATDDEASDRVRPPRLVKQLLSHAVVRDGSTRLYARPRVVEIQDVPEVFRAIKDPDRTASVIIAPSLGLQTMDGWTQVLEQLTKDSVGVATVFILTGEARERLAHLLPDSHAVERGNIRTFAPGVDLESPADGASHRYLGATTLARSLLGLRVREGLQIQHAREARRRFLKLTLPDDVEAAFRILTREEARVLRSSKVRERLQTHRSSHPVRPAFPAVPVSPTLAEPPALSDAQELVELERTAPDLLETQHGGVDSPRPVDPARPMPSPAVTALLRRLTSMVGRWLKKPRFELSHLDELDEFIEMQDQYQEVVYEENEELRRKTEALEADLKTARSENDALEFELKVSEDDSQAAYRMTQTLRRQLLELREFDRAYAFDEESELWTAPPDMSELMARLDPKQGEQPHPITTHVVFSGDVATALKVGRHDGFGRHASSLWLFLRILHDYAAFRKDGTFSGSVHAYLEDDTSPQGTKCSTERHARTESDGVLNNPRLRSYRILPAPTRDEAARTVLMAAHFKPTKNDGYAPRLHYLDDLDESGCIYVGYIGEHLPLPKKY
ncbi:hypothetical protein [Frondihabitans peucedani]|uniref:Uncharacterized protein n=1 Tax=Frondihabitans peucedani TaxID=598626 RepID=A0ABP8DX24_9MICO